MSKVAKLITISFLAILLQLLTSCNEEETQGEAVESESKEVVEDGASKIKEPKDTPDEAVVEMPAIPPTLPIEETPNSVLKCDVFNEQGGIVIIEAENTKSDLDFWELKQSVSDYKGSGHLEFTGNNTSSGPPTSPISYKFKINKGGTYRLIIRSHKRITPPDEGDKSNDSFVRLEGNFTLPPADVAMRLRDIVTPLGALKRDLKMFGGDRNGWGWSLKFDKKVAPDIERRTIPYYHLLEGETYTFVVSGRAKQYNIDRIIFYNIDDFANLEAAQNSSNSSLQNACL